MVDDKANIYAELTQLERSTMVRYARGMKLKEIAVEDDIGLTAMNFRIKGIRKKLGKKGLNLAHITAWCLYHGKFTLGDIFDSPTTGKASGYDLTRRNNVRSS